MDCFRVKSAYLITVDRNPQQNVPWVLWQALTTKPPTAAIVVDRKQKKTLALQSWRAQAAVNTVP
jgi:hypothetical protein